MYFCSEGWSLEFSQVLLELGGISSNRLKKPPRHPLLLPLCPSHSSDPQSFPLKLQELKVVCVLLPLGTVQLGGERNFLFFTSFFLQ